MLWKKDEEMKYRIIFLRAWMLREEQIQAAANEKWTVFLKRGLSMCVGCGEGDQGEGQVENTDN